MKKEYPDKAAAIQDMKSCQTFLEGLIVGAKSINKDKIPELIEQRDFYVEELSKLIPGYDYRYDFDINII